ncbi:MAG: DMT family transporter [Actinomycetota bacterium]|nr:DMT family transporter [Actinomycetota bacterium]
MTASTAAPRPATRHRVAGLVVAITLGVALATQARINGELAGRIGDGVAAALLSFVTGELILLVLVLVMPRMRRGVVRVVHAVRDGELRPWQVLGGMCGAFLVITQGLTVGTIGVAVFTVAVVAGQATSSLVVDRAGLGPGAAHPVTGTRILGALLAIGAVTLAVSDRLGTPSVIGVAVLPVLAGFGVAWQQAVNGRVSAAAGEPGSLPARGAGGELVGRALAAALVNFTVGTALLLMLAGVIVTVRGLPGPLPAEPLLYLGGSFGVLFIAAAAVIVSLTGVLLLGLGTVAGQLVGALLLDWFLPAVEGQVSAVTVTGTVLTLIAMAVAALPTRYRR